MTRYGRSPWTDEFPKSRIPAYSPHRGSFEADAVIVGGGLTGCTTASVLAGAGVNVVLLEAGRIGQGSSAAANGWISSEPGPAFADVEKALGRRSARHVWQSWRRAALDFSAYLRRLKVKCDLEPRISLQLGATPEQVALLKREQKARRSGGIDASLVNAIAIANETAMAASLALRSRDSATINPYRATVGLAAAAVHRGARLFEKSPVRKVTFNRKRADVHTAGGVIRTRNVVVATGYPTPVFKALIRHFWYRSTFLALTEPVPAKTRHQLGSRAAVVRDSATPPHIIRWVDDQRLLVAGADAETGPDRLREKTIIQRTGQLMYELSTMYPDISGLQPSHGWDAPYARTADGLPYIGRHRNYPHHLFSFGDSSHSLTGSYLTSRVVLRHVLGEADDQDEALSFNRYGHVR